MSVLKRCNYSHRLFALLIDILMLRCESACLLLRAWCMVVVCAIRVRKFRSSSLRGIVCQPFWKYRILLCLRSQSTMMERQDGSTQLKPLPGRYAFLVEISTYEYPTQHLSLIGEWECNQFLLLHRHLNRSLSPLRRILLRSQKIVLPQLACLFPKPLKFRVILWIHGPDVLPQPLMSFAVFLDPLLNLALVRSPRSVGTISLGRYRSAGLLRCGGREW